ncbi:MAG: PD40 domain-containing protein [Anaerolineae bacterium]|nr:PD40 domain-containing protein [Anaerolineae bacterium]
MPRPYLYIWLGVLFVWAMMLVYLGWQLFRHPTSDDGVLSAGFAAAQVDLPTPTPPPTNTAIPLSTPAQPVALLTATELPPLPTEPVSLATGVTPPPPPPGGTLLSLSPAPGAVGWTSSIDGHSHMGDNKIHVGFFKGHVYHGAIQVDLSAVPPGSRILYAALELTGLSDRNLGQGGVWQVRLLTPEIDGLWANLNYDRLRMGDVASTLQPALPAEHLRTTHDGVFVFDEEQRHILEQRLAEGRISFRIDGPSSGLDNLFTWAAQPELPPTTEPPGDDTRSPVEALPIKLTIVTEALNYVVVTSTPTPENVLTVAAYLDAETTITPLPSWVTPIIVTTTPAPANEATVAYHAQVATAEAQVFGTATPLPINIWTATPTPLLQSLAELPQVTPTATRRPIPQALIGKIAFLSDRAGSGDDQSGNAVFVMEPDGSTLSLLVDRAIYEAALARDQFSADQYVRAFTDKVQQENGQTLGIFVYDYYINQAEQISRFDVGMATQPVWSPTQDRFAFVSDNSSAEEIWSMNRDGGYLVQLTRNGGEEVNRHPSYSPDGSHLVFWSNQSGRAQIWIMDTEGRDQRVLHESTFNDWNPVWIKYTDPVLRPLPGERRTGPPELQ